MGGAEEGAVARGVMRVVFKDYLNRIARIERGKPEGERKRVPLLEEVAEAVGIHPITLSRIINNQTKRLNLDLMSDTISFMRALGFSMRETDFMVYEELPSLEE